VKQFLILLAFALCFLGAATTAIAGPVGTVAYDNTCPQASVTTTEGTFNPACQNQNYGNLLGLDFQVVDPIDIFALGMYNGGNPDIAVGVDGESGVTVLIYSIDHPGCSTDCAASLITSVHFDPRTVGADQQGAEAFLSLPSAVKLLPGYYSVVTWNDWNWNTYVSNPYLPNNDFTTLDDGGGLIIFDGAGRYDPVSGCGFDLGCSGVNFPTTVDTGPVDRYMAGSFTYEDDLLVVPEPASVGLIGAGLMGVWLLRRRYHS